MMGETKIFRQSWNRRKGKRLKELCHLGTDIKTEFGQQEVIGGDGLVMPVDEIEAEGNRFRQGKLLDNNADLTLVKGKQGKGRIWQGSLGQILC